MRRRAEGATAENAPIEVPFQISVASVSKPIGLSRRVAGSSLSVLRKTSAAPARTPDRASGRTTAVVAPSGRRPRERAASSSRAVLNALRARIEGRVETRSFDISRLPHYNADITDDPAVAELYDPSNAAVLDLIGRTVAAGRARGAEVGLCGDMASDPAHLDALLRLGMRRISIAPAQRAPVKAAIAVWSAQG